VKIIFAGTPDFAASALEALLVNQYDVIAVLTQPDRPAGRGMHLTHSPVKKLALQHNINVMQPNSLKTEEVQQQLLMLQADVMVVAAYGLILPLEVLRIPQYGCLNIHASLLPRWRGAAPIQRAILAGDEETGITIMQMDQGLDTGAMLLKKTCAIAEKDTAKSLHDKLANLGAQAIIETLDKLKQGTLIETKQDSALATYAAKLVKSEAELNWNQDATELLKKIRAYNPVPTAFSTLNGAVIKIWEAELANHRQHEAGTIMEVSKQGILIACGNGSLNLKILQRPNGKALPASQFIQGFEIKSGDKFNIN
jgi:methionyl-tRNA formyltransferase